MIDTILVFLPLVVVLTSVVGLYYGFHYIVERWIL